MSKSLRSKTQHLGRSVGASVDPNARLSLWALFIKESVRNFERRRTCLPFTWRQEDPAVEKTCSKLDMGGVTVFTEIWWLSGCRD